MERVISPTASLAVYPGYFGKLPSRGDFVSRGLASVTVAAFDAWISPCLAACREELAEDWSAIWDAAPVWHFVLPAGQCGPWRLIGVLCPSRDKADRRFPLIAAAEIPAPWQGQDDGEAEAIYHETLEDSCRLALTDEITPDALFARLATISAPDIGHPAIGQWWTAGADLVSAGNFASNILPDPAQFIRMVQD